MAASTPENNLEMPKLNYMIYIYRARGSNLTLVRQILGTRAPMDTLSVASYCVKYNQHVKHDNTRGSGACSPGKFGKTDALRLNLGAFQKLIAS